MLTAFDLFPRTCHQVMCQGNKSRYEQCFRHKDFHGGIIYSIMFNNKDIVKKLVSIHMMKLNKRWKLSI